MCTTSIIDEYYSEREETEMGLFSGIQNVLGLNKQKYSAPTVKDYSKCMQAMIKNQHANDDVLAVLTREVAHSKAIGNLKHYKQSIETLGVDAALMAVINDGEQLSRYMGRSIPAVTPDNATLVATICVEGLSESIAATESVTSTSFFGELKEKALAFIDSMLERNVQQKKLVEACDGSKANAEAEVTGFSKEQLDAMLDAIPALVDKVIACVDAKACEIDEATASLLGVFGYKYESGTVSNGDAKVVAETKKLSDFGITGDDIPALVSKLSAAMDAVDKLASVKEKLGGHMDSGAEEASSIGADDAAAAFGGNTDVSSNASESSVKSGTVASASEGLSSDGAAAPVAEVPEVASEVSKAESVASTKSFAANVIVILDLINEFVNEIAVQFISICEPGDEASSSSESSNGVSSELPPGDEVVPEGGAAPAAPAEGDDLNEGGAAAPVAPVEEAGTVQQEPVVEVQPVIHPDGCQCEECKAKHVAGCQCESCKAKAAEAVGTVESGAGGEPANTNADNATTLVSPEASSVVEAPPAEEAVAPVEEAAPAEEAVPPVEGEEVIEGSDGKSSSSSDSSEEASTESFQFLRF